MVGAASSSLSALPYRRGVGVMLINAAGLVFAGQRIDTPTDAWQMPQGGIDEGEAPLEAVFREMEEEIGTNKAVVLGETSDWLSYELPADIAGRLWKGRYRGQTQKWYAMRFTGTDADIRIDTPHPEFRAWRWMDAGELQQRIVPFKRPLYDAVFRELSRFAAPV